MSLEDRHAASVNLMLNEIIFRLVRIRRGRPALPYKPLAMEFPSAQLSCHDAPIFRLLLKIAVSLTASNVTFSIFARLRAATKPQPKPRLG